MKSKVSDLYQWAMAAGLIGLVAVAACSSDQGSDNPSAAGAAGAAIGQAGAAPAGASNGGGSVGGGAAGSSGSNSAAGSAGASGGFPGGGATAAGGASGAGIGGAAGQGGAGAAGHGGSAGGSAGAGGAPQKFVGNITTGGAVRDGFAKYWNQITPENEGKWGSVEQTRNNRSWSSLDKIYAYTQDNDIAFKQHVFVWGSQQPSWIAGLSAAEQQASVKAWMQAFCDRYPNTKLIDVVNEPPPHTTPSYKDGIGGDGASGYDWIVNAFKWARAACPNAILIMNDYNTIEYGNDNGHFIDIVTAIKKAGAPIDAIGAQAHDAYKIPTNTVKGFIDKLAATGLPVYITEYDIPLADDNQQKNVMQEQMTMYLNHPSVKGVTLWGYVVGSTWKDNTGLQQTNGTMRPAMTWLMSYLGRQ